jgi:hypothetical protein
MYFILQEKHKKKCAKTQTGKKRIRTKSLKNGKMT